MTAENTEVKTITITIEEYNELVDDSNQLAHLEAYGVDGWEGYSRYDTTEDYLRYNDED